MVAIAALLLGPACGLGDKARLEDRITSAPARLEGSIVAGTLSVESRLVDVPAGVGVSAFGASFGGANGEPTTFPRGGVSFGLATAPFVLDLASSRATLLKPAAADPQPASAAPAVIFDDLVLYGRRGGVPADDARPWVRLDLDDIDDTAGELDPIDGAAAAAIFALHPALVTDLVAGALTGSIERRKLDPDDASLAPDTTRYGINVSVRKALQETRRSRYPEDRRASVEELLRLLGVKGDLHPAEVWLDADGGLRRFRVELHQEPQRKVKFRLLVGVDLPPVADGETPEVLTAPGVDQVLGVDSVLRFTSTVAATGAAEDEPAEGSSPPPVAEPAP